MTERRHENPGHPPRRWSADTRLGIEWANGTEARHTYFASQLRWTLTGHDFDIGRFWKA
jgi:hypothetical protein